MSAMQRAVAELTDASEHDPASTHGEWLAARRRWLQADRDILEAAFAEYRAAVELDALDEDGTR